MRNRDSVASLARRLACAAVSLMAQCASAVPAATASKKPRVIATTDGEVDDRSSMVRFLLSFFAVLAIACSSAEALEQWGVFELALPSREAPRTIDSAFSATFSQGSQSVSVPGFWDGENVFKVRFSPPTLGQWNYVTHSKHAALDGKTGSLTVDKSSDENHGPVQPFDTFYLRYADGTPYHQFGTTCYAWVHQPESLQQQTLNTLAASPFNKIRFCIFPKSYVYNKNEPEFFAFPKGIDGKFEFDRPDPAFWKYFEQRILDLQKLGIEADLILWHPYDRWGFSEMSDAQEWIFFAATYDAASDADNVAWYFSAPLDSPSASAEIQLNRRTTYNAGPVATDIGPLAIGNFNDTMKGFGLDRQFRGQIRGLQIYGSRIGRRGALKLEDIKRQLP